MLSTPLICSSMGVATDCARVSASAPTNVACSFVSGGTILGNCEIGSPRIVMAPMMTVRIAITMATIGRWMKNLDIFQLPADAVVDGVGADAVVDGVGADAVVDGVGADAVVNGVGVTV